MDGFGEADALLGAAETRRADADRPVALTDVAKADCRAVGVRLRALAADLVQAESLTMAGVAELQRKASGIKVRPALAVLVDDAAIREARPVQLVQCRRFAESQNVQHRSEEHTAELQSLMSTSYAVF